LLENTPKINNMHLAANKARYLILTLFDAFVCLFIQYSKSSRLSLTTEHYSDWAKFSLSD